MGLTRRLLQFGSMSDSLGVYVPAIAGQKLLGFIRLLVLLYLFGQTAGGPAEYALWGLGSVIFQTGAPLLTLGTTHSLVRYVSHYEARGQLRIFFRRMWLFIVPAAVLMVGIGLLAAGPITAAVITSAREVTQIPWARQVHVCLLALVNTLGLCLFLNLMGFMYGLRAYRPAAATEVAFTVFFTAAAIPLVIWNPTADMLLWCHLGSLVLAGSLGMLLLNKAVHILSADPALRRAGQAAQPIVAEAPVAEIDPTGAAAEPAPDAPPASDAGAMLKQVLSYGLVALWASLVWDRVGYLSFWMTNKWFGHEVSGVFYGMLTLSQAVIFLANAAWSVVFSHVARVWESGRQKAAVGMLQLSYKCVCLTMMTLAVVVYATSPGWILALPERFRAGLALLGGLLMFFQVMTHLSIANILAKLQERPSVIGFIALAGAGVFIAAALWLKGNADLQPRDLAWAVAVGMWIGGCAVSAGYLLLSRVKLQAATWVLMFSPGILALGLLGTYGRIAVAGVWLVVLIVAGSSDALFDRREKRRLSVTAGRYRNVIRRRLTGRGS